MTDLLDTSVLVRYLTMDPPDQGARAQELIDSASDLAIPVVALAETAYVLTRLYGLEDAAAVDVLVALLGRTNLRPFEIQKGLAVEAMMLSRPSARISFADALIWAAARASRDGRVFTFDQRFPATAIDRQLL